jgi:AsmA protein
VRITLFGLAAIAVIGAIFIFVGPLFISTDDLRDKLFAQVETATGYRLRVSGPVQVSLFPSLDLVAEDVGIAQGGADAKAEMARAKSLRFGLQLSALLGGKVKLTELTLIDPVIAVPRAEPAANAGEDAGKPQPGVGSPSDALKSLSLDKLLIKNGTLILPGSGGAPGKRIEALNLEASLPAPDAPLAFDASASLDGKTIKTAGSIGGLAQLLDGEAVPVSLSIDAPAYLDERAVLNGIATYQGETFAFSQFTARAGDKSLAGSGSYKGNLLTLHPLTINASGNSLSGSVVADLSGAVPAVNAAFSGQTLNLDALLGTPNSTQAAASSSAGDGGWSDAKIDFSGLRAVTAKLKLSAGQLIYNQIKISNATLQATIAGGKLSASLPSFQLYGGAGAAALDVDASGKIPVQRIRLSLAKFEAYPFLKDSAGFESLEGTGAITLDVSGSGASQRAIVGALSGTAKFEFTDGAIRGINIAKAVRGLTTGILAGWQENAAEKTDFATLGASFKLAKGQAQTADLQMAGPLVRMTGAGTVDLPGKALKFRVDPQLVASLEGQGGKSDLQGLGVPIMISGPWARPSIYPDIEGILSNPAAAYEQLNRLGGGLVSLPGAGNTGSVSAVGGLIKGGKVSTDALQQGALGGIGALLGVQQQQPVDEAVAAEPAPEPTPAAKTKVKPKPVSDAAPAETKKAKKRQAAAEPSQAPTAAARQLMQGVFGN